MDKILEYLKYNNTYEYELLSNKKFLDWFNEEKNYELSMTILPRLQEFIDNITEEFQKQYKIHGDTEAVLASTINNLVDGQIDYELYQNCLMDNEVSILHVKNDYEIDIKLNETFGYCKYNKKIENIFGIDIENYSIEKLYNVLDNITNEFDLSDLKQLIDIKNFNEKLRNKMFDFIVLKLFFESKTPIEGYKIVNNFVKHINFEFEGSTNTYRITNMLKEILIIKQYENKILIKD